ncbi:hypothetical protein E2562_022449 [Oryza meyeriana var. granulata]|uniref:DUF834 domain-containing protein n=1 Tax=Oryza meyeriana var. granulata TaxID=110450 RepID=A0A6G1BN66_9ORYZ|nr:hypothetical protein E2562_022449 [Oryza meyeriana var. granulata]
MTMTMATSGGSTTTKRGERGGGSGDAHQWRATTPRVTTTTVAWGRARGKRTGEDDHDGDGSAVELGEEHSASGTYDNSDDQQKEGQVGRCGAHRRQATTSSGTSASGFSHRAMTEAGNGARTTWLRASRENERRELGRAI